MMNINNEKLGYGLNIIYLIVSISSTLITGFLLTLWYAHSLDKRVSVLESSTIMSASAYSEEFSQIRESLVHMNDKIDRILFILPNKTIIKTEDHNDNNY